MTQYRHSEGIADMLVLQLVSLNFQLNRRMSNDFLLQHSMSISQVSDHEHHNTYRLSAVWCPETSGALLLIHADQQGVLEPCLTEA